MISSGFERTILLIIIAITSHQALAQPPYLKKFCFPNQGNYTTNSTYQTNLKTLLSRFLLPIKSKGYGFYSSSNGQNNVENVYASGLCRGDVDPKTCHICLSIAADTITQVCPNKKQAILWRNNCTLRYSNRTLYGVMEAAPPFLQASNQNVAPSVVDGFNQELKSLMERLKSEAAAGSSDQQLKFAIGNTTLEGSNTSQTIYGLAQCTPDLSEKDCNDCLVSAFGNIPWCCQGKTGGRVGLPSCNLRFEVYNFLYQNNTAILSKKNNTAITGGKIKSSHRFPAKIIIIVTVSVSLVLIICIYICVRVRRATKRPVDEDQIRSAQAFQFEFSSIKVATNNFSEENKLGWGGFGDVYKGRLVNGEDIAVKRLSRESTQGDLEFKNEVSLVARLQHRNLVKLLRFSLEGDERLLVYEFVPYGSLDQFISDPIKRAQWDWDSRYKIILGVARGLLYLHEDSRLRIVHRDLKASNILLDAEMSPKISDFGMAKLFMFDQRQGETSRIVGTYGYMAPEYLLRGHYSDKSDVYSFGVLVLEIVSGQKISSFRHEDSDEDLLSYALKNWKEETTSNLIDPMLRLSSTSEIMRCIHIGLLCVQQNIADRPTMSSVIQMLTSSSLTLPIPSEPPFFTVGVNTLGSDHSKSNSTQNSANEASITELFPR